jgi:uncharacterized protein YdhG (YjbR/CyaY superfamily)
MAAKFTSVEEYVAALPEEARAAMEGIRRSIHAVVPGVGEQISYAMPTFTLDGRPLVHVAAWQKHIGLYPLPSLDGPLADEVAPYRSETDTMRLPLNGEIPYGLVGRVVAVLVDRRAASDSAGPQAE